PKNLKPRSTSRTHKARREDRTLTVDLARCDELRSQLTSAAPSLWRRSKMGVFCAAQTEYGSSGTRFRISGLFTDCVLDWWGAHILDRYGRLPTVKRGWLNGSGARTYIRRHDAARYVLRAVMSCEPAGSNTHACSI